MTRLRRRLRTAVLLFCLLQQRPSLVGAAAPPPQEESPREQTLPEKSTQKQWIWWKEKAALPNAADDDHSETEITTKNETSQSKKAKKKNDRKSPQKITNCLHLTTAAADGYSNKSLFLRAFKRISLRAASATRDMNLAYGMVIAATLSYWDFHKKALPENRTSFEIISYRNGYAQPIRRKWGHRRSRAMRMVVSSVRLALDQANPMLSLVPSRRRRTIKSRYSSYPQKQQQQQQAMPTSFKEAFQSMTRTTTSFKAAFQSMKSRVRQTLFHDSWKNQQGQYHMQLEFSLYNWYEPTPLGNYHDTDILVATSNHGQNLIVAFAGTASVPDTVTNLQTFESIQHSGFFFHNNKTALEGSIHRGFLNAYSRVERGYVLNLCSSQDGNDRGNHNCHVDGSLFRDYGHCTAEEPQQRQSTRNGEGTSESDSAGNNTADTTTTTTWKRGRGCKVKHRKLMTILRELAVEYLSAGKSVHLVGHSLGGSLATLYALDIIVNFPNVPVHKLELWTFGGAQLADDAFYQSALTMTPRLKNFLQIDSIMGVNLQQAPVGNMVPTQSRRSQCHRFVTVSDDCQVDFVSTVTQKTLAPENDGNFHGKTARKLGGIRGSSVVHLVDPHYLLTPDQYSSIAGMPATKSKAEVANSYPTAGKNTTEADPAPSSAPPQDKEKQPSTTRSTLAAHSTSNYLKGISRESRDHPLSSDLPKEVRQWLGEIIVL